MTFFDWNIELRLDRWNEEKNPISNPC
jgi:hypothetical protein